MKFVRSMNARSLLCVEFFKFSVDILLYTIYMFTVYIVHRLTCKTYYCTVFKMTLLYSLSIFFYAQRK